MAGKSTRWIWMVMMIFSLTSTAVLSLPLDTCLATLNGYLSALSGAICNQSNTQEQLAGTMQAFFTCPSNGGSDIVIERWDKYPSDDGNVQMDIQDNSPKYGTSTDRLQINNIESNDEGAYVCTLMVDGADSMQALGGCLVIYGKAEFVTSGNELNIIVNIGEDIVFDTALKFGNGGSCGLNQTISILQLQKIGVGDVVDCDNFPSCQEDANFAYSELGNITKSNATSEDAGQYRLGVSVEDPQTDVLQRTFNVMVMDNPTPSVAGPTQSPAPTLASPTASPSSTVENRRETGDDDTVEIVVSIVVILLAIPIITALIMIVLVLWIKHKKRQKNSIKKQEPYYDNIHPSNGSGNVHISDDYGYHASLPFINENNRHSGQLEDVYLADRPTDQEGNV